MQIQFTDNDSISVEGKAEIIELENEAIVATADIEKPTDCSEAEAEEFALRIIKAAASLKAVKIDRGKFLRSEIKRYAPDIDANLAVERTPIEAGISPQVLDKIASAAIDLETRKCAGLSFIAGVPGGVALAGTVPADLAQYLAHVMRVEQKLAYLYGWQSFLNEGDEVDDATLMELVILMGVMLEIGGAANGITKFATNVAQKGVAKTIERQALTKTTFYPIMKSVLRVLGINLTKQTFAKTVSKVVPVVGGVVSGTLTYATFKPGAERLRKYLRALPTSGIDVENEVDGAPESFLETTRDGFVGKAQDMKTALTEDAQTAGETIAEGVKTASAAIASGAQTAGSTALGAAKTAGGLLGSLVGRKK